MHINFDLLRDILEDIDTHDAEEPLTSDWLHYDYATHSEVLFHIKILAHEGYISCIDLSCADGYCFAGLEMTIKGALFIEQFRDKTLFEQVKNIAFKSFQATSLADFLTIAQKITPLF